MTDPFGKDAMVRHRARSALTSGAILLALVGWSGPAAAETPADEPSLDTAMSVAGNFLAGRFAIEANDFHAAAVYYREALARDPGNMRLLEQSFQFAMASGALDQGFALAQRIIAADKDHRLARFVLGVRLLKLDKFNDARASLSQASEGLIPEVSAGVLSAWAFQGVGETDAALDAIARLPDNDWVEIFKSYHSGLIAEASGDNEGASRHFAEAYRKNSDGMRIVEAHARSEARAGRYDSALRVIEAFDETVINHPLLEDLRRMIEARRAIPKSVTTARQGAAEFLYGIGTALIREEREMKRMGAIYLQLALDLDPEHPLAFFALAELYDSVGQRERANAMFDRIKPESPVWRNAQIQVATNLDALDKTEEALQRLEILLEADVTDLEAATTLGNILRGRERFKEAAAAYTRAIDSVEDVDKRHWSLYYYRGIAYERAKEWPKAEADFQKALELSPDQPLVLNYLGYSWVDKNLHLDEAIDMIRKAVELRPEDGYIVDSLGWAYYRLGQYDKAVEELERAIELRPQDVTINDHLGDGYWQVGRKLEARYQWQRALELMPDDKPHEDRDEIRKKLEEGMAAAAAAPPESASRQP